VRLSFERAFEVGAGEFFAFHQNPNNLALLLRGWTTFRMVANDGHIRVGSMTRVQERVGSLWFSMTFEHFVYEPLVRFGERQVRGPFKKLEHVHEFESTGSRTILRDVLDVVLPGILVEISRHGCLWRRSSAGSLRSVTPRWTAFCGLG